MPELPEVETIRRDLEKELVGRTVLDITYSVPKVLQPSPKAVLETTKGRKIESLGRRGKLLLVRLSGNKTLGIHLRLTGRLFVRKEGDLEDEWQRVVIRFSGGKELRFSDLRLFGYIKLFKDEKEVEAALGKIGPEPSLGRLAKSGLAESGGMDAEKFYAMLHKTSRPVKIILLDQERIAGIGNIYANEALFEAGIHPSTKADQLTRKQATALYKAVVQVLEEGIALRGATIADEMYRDVYGRRGGYEKKVRVYQQAGKPCPRCGTAVRRIMLGGRGTFFCPKCQPAEAHR